MGMFDAISRRNSIIKIDVSNGIKRCSRCLETKPLSAFNKRNDRPQSLSYRSWCKFCIRQKEREEQGARSEYSKKYREKNRELLRDKFMKKRYGCSLSMFLQLEKSQNGRCAICKKTKKLQLDHNHKTGKIRGLLCSNCNCALGLVSENFRILQRMGGYLRGDV